MCVNWQLLNFGQRFEVLSTQPLLWRFWAYHWISSVTVYHASLRHWHVYVPWIKRSVQGLSNSHILGDKQTNQDLRCFWVTWGPLSPPWLSSLAGTGIFYLVYLKLPFLGPLITNAGFIVFPLGSGLLLLLFIWDKRNFLFRGFVEIVLKAWLPTFCIGLSDNSWRCHV